MYVPGVDNSTWQWLLNFAMFLVVLFAFAAALPVLTGLACGWVMRNISIRYGLMTGLSVGVIAFLLSLAAIMIQAASLAIVLLPVSPGITWLLCLRRNRKRG